MGSRGPCAHGSGVGGDGLAAGDTDDAALFCSYYHPLTTTSVVTRVSQLACFCLRSGNARLLLDVSLYFWPRFCSFGTGS